MRGGSWLGRLCLVILGAVVGLALVEALLGGPLRPEVVDQRDPAWQARLRAMHEALYQADEDLVYVPRPGASMPMDYGVAAFNDEGLREAGPVAPSPGRRVAVLGDSLVWGELLAPEHTLPAQLGARLGPEVQVLNFGVSGYDTVQEAAWYRRQVRSYAPEVVLLVFCLNDLLTMSGPLQLYGDEARLAAYQAERDQLDGLAPLRNETISRLWLEERRGDGSRVVAAARHTWRWHQLFTLPGGYVDELLLAGRDPTRRARVSSALFQLGADLEDDGATGLLLISPALYWWHDYQWGEVHAWVRAEAEAAGFAVLDPIETWAGQDPTKLRFGGDNLHYTPAGIAALAELTAPWLARAGEPPGADASARPR